MAQKSSPQKLECPACYGDGKTFHKTYGTESSCWLCRGHKTVTEVRLTKLDLI